MFYLTNAKYKLQRITLIKKSIPILRAIKFLNSCFELTSGSVYVYRPTSRESKILVRG